MCFGSDERWPESLIYLGLPALQLLFPRRYSDDSLVEVIQRICEIEGAWSITDNKRVCEDRGETALQVENTRELSLGSRIIDFRIIDLIRKIVKSHGIDADIKAGWGYL